VQLKTTEKNLNFNNLEMFNNLKGRESKRVFAKFIEILNSGQRTYNLKMDDNFNNLNN